MELVRHMMWTACVVVAPIMTLGLVAGLVVGVLQAATQIQESSLNFLPKLVVIGLAIALGGPWFLEKLVTFTGGALEELAFVEPRGGP